MQFIKVKIVKPVQQKKDIYHLTVTNNHNFFGNNICLHNCGFRGNCAVKLYNLGEDSYQVKKGDKIAQLVIYPLIHADISWSDEKTETMRGQKGFGSSDKEEN